MKKLEKLYEGKAKKLYKTSSNILHGENIAKGFKPLTFIQRTFKLIEQLTDL